MGKPADPEYWIKWRAAHPDYRARQNRLRADRRKTQGRGPRLAEYAKRPSRAYPPIPPLHTGHFLFDMARAVVGQRKTALTTLYDPLYDDLMSEAVLALVEHRDAGKAVKRYRTKELNWGRSTAPLFTSN